MTPLQAADAMHVPAFGTFTPAKSKYYVGQVVDPVSGTHYDADSGLPTHASAGGAAAAMRPDALRAAPVRAAPVPEFGDEGPTIGAALGRFLVIFAGMLALGGLFAYTYPSAWVAPLLAVQFFAGLIMPVTRAVPWADEDADDVLYFVLLTLVFGPVIGPIIYMVVSLLKQDANPAIFGCFGVALVSLGVVEVARLAGMPTSGVTLDSIRIVPWASPFELSSLFVCWSGFAALCGWYCGSVFHKLDE